uniref:Uncharacterized protein n=1 Tax=Anguilla anguilla TaxID=7936 RepID=A0A0E9WSK6_ANGAN
MQATTKVFRITNLWTSNQLVQEYVIITFYSEEGTMGKDSILGVFISFSVSMFMFFFSKVRVQAISFE